MTDARERARWLFSMRGRPIAFVLSRSVFLPSGAFLGRLDDDDELWNGSYIGEIVPRDRLVRDDRKGGPIRRPCPTTPASPALRVRVASRAEVVLGPHFHEVSFARSSDRRSAP